jgi:hypothetical protein
VQLHAATGRTVWLGQNQRNPVTGRVQVFQGDAGKLGCTGKD